MDFYVLFALIKCYCLCPYMWCKNTLRNNNMAIRPDQGKKRAHKLCPSLGDAKVSPSDDMKPDWTSSALQLLVRSDAAPQLNIKHFPAYHQKVALKQLTNCK